jgi:hypothetical protein
VRYLFGDSTPFPLDIDFLSTLEKFMTATTRVVQLANRTTRDERELIQAEAERQSGLTTVALLHERLLRALERSAGEATHPAAKDYTARVGELAKRIREEQMRAARDAKEQGEEQIRAAAAQRTAEVRGYFEEFFLKAAQPMALWQATLDLVGEGKDARYTMGAVVHYPQRVGATYQLEPGGPFAHPCKVSDLVTGLELKVGVKKSFFKGVVTAEAMSIDDHVISSFDIEETFARISLRRKVTEKDSLVFHLRRSEQGVAAEVEHPGDPNAAQLPRGLDGSDVGHLDRLWHALRAATAPLLDRRVRLMGLTLDGHDVFERKLELALVARLVEVYAPLVTEIARRSPSDVELSLKREHDGGRREEIYLRRDELVAKLEALPSEGRAVFAPLGLEGWVPSATMAPPPIIAEEEG